MAQAVSYRNLIAEAQVRSQDIPCEIYGEQNGRGTGFFSDQCGFPLSLSFHQCHIYLFTYVLLQPDGQSDEAWEPFNKIILIRKTGKIRQKSTFTLED